MAEWGVTVLEATGEVDGGDVWATRTFRTREAGKSSLYRHEVRRAAVERGRRGGDGASPTAAARREPLDHGDPARDRPPAPADAAGRPRDRLERRTRPRPSIRRHPRRRGAPGRARHGRRARVPPLRRPPRGRLRGRPGEIIAQRARRRSAARRSTARSGSPTSSAARRDFKLPATRALALAGHELDVPELPRRCTRRRPAGGTFREIAYEERARCRLPALRLLQRRDEHRPVPAAARGLPLRARPRDDA